MKTTKSSTIQIESNTTSHSMRSAHIAALTVGVIASFAVFLDATMMNLALPTLSREFGANRSSIEWVIDAYTLTFSAIMLSAGVTSDSYGARRIFIPGMIIFSIASIGCAVSQNITMLNVFRLIQGAGAALLLPSSLSLTTQNVDGINLRRVAIAIWSAAGGIGLAAGPIISGIVVTSLGWRWLFWINVLVGLIAVAFTTLTKPSSRRDGVHLDLFGQVTATLVIGSIVFILIEGQHLGWTMPLLFVIAAICLVSVISFIIIERKTAYPLIPPRLAARAEFIGSALLGALFNLAFYGVLFALSLLFQDVKGESSLHAGLNFLPFTGLIFVGNLIAPRIARRFGATSVLYLGQAFFGVGLLTIVFTVTFTQPWLLAVSLLPAGFGAGLLVPTMTSRMLESLPQDLSGAASASFNTSRQLGGAIGVALFGNLLGSNLHLMTGFIKCFIASFICVAVSTVLTLILLREPRKHANDATKRSPH
ncbi:MFS transporter [Sporolactobacillus pectinivorans]|uniref:MFS transporter n=1 Tax=Sporolactobacillus pectinivorans TaxID=1591408 RepID=UPI000C261094|nr:MFS transporter [Sporolactobacillus pectinivorans]